MNSTQPGFITFPEATSCTDIDNVTTQFTGSNDVISDDIGTTVEAWLKTFQLVITPVLLILGKHMRRRVW